MERIILVSVLTTLGVVVMLTSIVVAFIKLKNKVGVNTFEKEMNVTHRRMDDIINVTEDKIDRLIVAVYETINNNHTISNRDFDDIRRIIDSRCDKLDEKIKVMGTEKTPKTNKQILQG